MGRKFSIDIPKLKIGTKNEGRPIDALTPDSPQTPIPKSILQLPSDLDAELRAACTWVVENYRPSHEVWSEATRPALNYAAVQIGLTAAFANKVEGVEEHRLRGLPESGSRYKYKPDVPTEDLFKNDGEAASQVENAAAVPVTAARVDQLMVASQRSMTVTTHADSPTLSKPESAQSDAHDIKTQPAKPVRPDHGSTESQETQVSTPESDATDNAWNNASTGITSAVITPASKRTSPSHATAFDFSNPQKVDSNAALHGHRVRTELEKHKKLQEERENMAHLKTREFAAAVSNGISVYKPSGSSEPASATFTTALPALSNASRENLQNSRGRAPEGRCVPHDSNSPQNTQRHRSRSRSVTRAVREYFRPGSSAAATRSRKASMDSQYHSARPVEHQEGTEEYWSSTSASARRGRWNLWRSGGQNRQYTTPDYSRPSSATGFFSSRLRSRSRAGSAGSSAQELASANDQRNDSVQRDVAAQHQFHQRPPKPAIDLNRELPPLPSLDQWKSDDEEEDSTYHPGFSNASTAFQQPFVNEPLLDESQAVFNAILPANASSRPLSTISIAPRPKRVAEVSEQEISLTPTSASRRSLDSGSILTNALQHSSPQRTPGSSRNSPRVATTASAPSPSHKSSSPAVSIRHVHSASAGGSDGQLQTARLSRQGLARSSSDEETRRKENREKQRLSLSHSKSHGLFYRDDEVRRHDIDVNPLHRTTAAQRVPVGSRTAQQQRYHLNPLQSHPVMSQPDLLQREDVKQQYQPERTPPDVTAAIIKGRRKWWGLREGKESPKQGRGRFFSSPPPVSHALRSVQVPWQQRC
ncbi:uncharacterized protein K489DRAFT_432050 [Dissoconium aciculare CBS 342.82]|uniref:Uncharacterized protein n=1 Tax=Dissoconium aciculare CBS 342.82 TaxID=1314786 RepID=A0A6J3M2F6_9PEZI|nr:uncharacterized protein K489DRAFT_432050 [Dissoconium aciculare CBS 342.82]KAF1822201.1 hypothetical protein K489DRAFT_432050 [Dissoconium aciculare CBS 342.82]